MSLIRLGIIGMSEGNGHPYSWSAIFNGYDPVEMEKCGFPAIPRYLEKQEFPRDAIPEAKVTHIWAQEKRIAEHVAKAAFIENLVTDYIDLIGQVDGVLLARDDAENHLMFAMPFLHAGIPIYVDKPLALSIKDANQLIAAQQYSGQLFCCSALRYAREFNLSPKDRMTIGQIRHIQATVMNDWDRYAIHVVEPALMLIPYRGQIMSTTVAHAFDATSLVVHYQAGIQLLIMTLGRVSGPLALRIIGDNGWKDLLFKDTFNAFKSALSDFVQGIMYGGVRIEREFMLETVRIIEEGRKK